MAEFHRFKPIILWMRTFKTHEYFDPKDKRWAAVFPPRKIIIILTRESDYPRECFGAPRNYCCYYTELQGTAVKANNKLVACGNSLEELEDNLRRYSENEAFANNILRFLLHALHEYEIKEKITLAEERAIW